MTVQKLSINSQSHKALKAGENKYVREQYRPILLSYVKYPILAYMLLGAVASVYHQCVEDLRFNLTMSALSENIHSAYLAVQYSSLV
jgi:hypothetical protein